MAHAWVCCTVQNSAKEHAVDDIAKDGYIIAQIDYIQVAGGTILLSEPGHTGIMLAPHERSRMVQYCMPLLPPPPTRTHAAQFSQDLESRGGF